MASNALLIIGMAGIAGAILLALYALGSFGREKVGVARSMAAIQAMDAASAGLVAEEYARPFGDRVVAPSYDKLSNLGRRLTPQARIERVQHKLELAGNPGSWSVDRVMAWKIIGLASGATLGFILTLLMQSSFIWVVASTALLAVTGFFVPNFVLYQVASERSLAIRRSLPDTIDLLAISVAAGLAFDAAVEQVARNTQGPLADEFFRVLSEMQIGRSRSDALRALAERTDVDDLKAFVTAMIQADEFGVPIARVLRTQSDELRVKRRQYAEERAQKVPVKLIFPLVLFIMPAIFVVLIGPAAFRIIDTFSGGGF